MKPDLADPQLGKLRGGGIHCCGEWELGGVERTRGGPSGGAAAGLLFFSCDADTH